jgi:hypothetical protein
MKLLGFTFALFFAANSFAQNVSVEPAKKRADVSSQGIRISLVKPVIQTKFQIIDNPNMMSLSYDSVNGSGIGIGLGYASLPASSIGWTTNLTYMKFSNPDEMIYAVSAIYRADFNIAYTFSDVFNIKGGVNLSKAKFESATYTTMYGEPQSTSLDNLPPSIGAQAGIGIQFNKYAGIDINAIYMAQEGTVDSKQISLKQTSAEIALNGTF